MFKKKITVALIAATTIIAAGFSGAVMAGGSGWICSASKCVIITCNDAGKCWTKTIKLN